MLVPVFPLTGFTGTQVAAFSGVMLVVRELLLLAAVAVAGKQGFAYIRTKVFGIIRPKVRRRQ